MLLSQLRDTNNNDQSLKVQSPVGFSSLVCFVSFVFMNWVAKPAVKLLEVDWAELLVDTIISISVTFVTLYRSCWHREITGAARTLSLIFISVGAGTKGERREFKRRKLFWLCELSLGRGAEEAGA
jgi:hypothetical protein